MVWPPAHPPVCAHAEECVCPQVIWQFPFCLAIGLWHNRTVAEQPMKKKTSTLLFSIFLICFSALLLVSVAVSEEKAISEWHKHEVSFRVLNATSLGSSVWICGADEGVAVSSDGGQHWQTKHQTKDGALLLNIDFANDKFGYATGTGGLFLTTEDAGETWLQHSTGSFTILQAFHWASRRPQSPNREAIGVSRITIPHLTLRQRPEAVAADSSRLYLDRFGFI